MTGGERWTSQAALGFVAGDNSQTPVPDSIRQGWPCVLISHGCFSAETLSIYWEIQAAPQGREKCSTLRAQTPGSIMS